MQRSTELQTLFSEIVKLARTLGSHDARITRAEADVQRLSASMATTTTAMPSTGAMSMEGGRRASMREMESWIEVLRLTGKGVLWVAPRAIMAWGLVSGWFAAAWRWIVAHFGFLLVG